MKLSNLFEEYYDEPYDSPFTDENPDHDPGGDIPDSLYRVVAPAEYALLQKSGFLWPSRFYKRIHASADPERQYGNAFSYILKINTKPSHQWTIKYGDKTYYTTYRKIPKEDVEVFEFPKEKPTKKEHWFF